MLLMPTLLLSLSANAAEVVWMTPPSDGDRDLVAAQAGASGPVLTPIDVRSASTAWNSEDDDAWRDLEATLQDVRAYETKLDGELLIMRDLAIPINKIKVVRDENDRNKLFAALTYQGFAVNRFFDSTLGDDPEAAPYRMLLEGEAIEQPWFDAVALDPERTITPYDIAEAPQRVQYKEVAALVAAALPASLMPANLPATAKLFVDGREAALGPAGNVKVVAGRHIAHATLDGAIIARWDVHSDVGQSVDLPVALTDEIWTGFLDGLSDGASTPDALLPQIEALGGEVWFAEPGDKVPEVFIVDGNGVRSITIVRPKVERPDDELSGIHATVGMGGAWFYSGDFLLQNPTQARDNPATVNAAATQIHLGAEYHMAGLMMVAGVDTDIPLGVEHVANSGGNEFRLRPYPYIGFGIPLLQASVGYVLPYHPALGASSVLSLGGPLILRTSARYGLPGKFTNSAGGVYSTDKLFSIGATVGVRL